MSVTQYIIILCWAIFLLYWFVSGRNVKQSQEVAVNFGNYRWIVLTVIVTFILISHFALEPFFHIPGCQITWRGCHYSLSANARFPLFVQIIGDLLAVLGIGIAVVARKTLGSNWSANVDLKKEHELLTQGIYGYVRHPIYTGVLTIELGTLLLFPSIITVISAIFVFSLLLFKLKQEEALLTKHFPKDYPVYKKRVKALIPYII